MPINAAVRRVRESQDSQDNQETDHFGESCIDPKSLGTLARTDSTFNTGISPKVRLTQLPQGR